MEKNEALAVKYFEYAAADERDGSHSHMGSPSVYQTRTHGTETSKTSLGPRTRARVCLGACYASGIGETKDDRKAFTYYLLAAEDGDEISQYNVGLFYTEGRGVPKDERTGFRYLKQAADNGILHFLICF